MIDFPEIEKIAEPLAPRAEQAAQWWWWAGAAVLGLMVAAFVIWGLWTLYRLAALPAVPPPPEKPALRELTALRKRQATLSDPEFGTALSAVVRTYLHRRTGLPARFATTEEITGSARRPDQVPAPPVTGAFAAVLTQCDALKFGTGSRAGREDLLAAAESALTAAAKTPVPPPAPSLPENPAHASAA